MSGCKMLSRDDLRRGEGLFAIFSGIVDPEDRQSVAGGEAKRNHRFINERDISPRQGRRNDGVGHPRFLLRPSGTNSRNNHPFRGFRFASRPGYHPMPLPGRLSDPPKTAKNQARRTPMGTVSLRRKSLTASRLRQVAPIHCRF
jgi:hypothetical protein